MLNQLEYLFNIKVLYVSMLNIDMENVLKRLKYTTCLELDLLIPMLQQHLNCQNLIMYQLMW
jgi:hypothetical protein